MSKQYDAIALFSGGLDSLLASLVVQAQGLSVLCLHFCTPFFGQPDKISRWRDLYSLDIEKADVGDDFVKMIVQGPEYGFGKHINPCVDCKILMLSRAREMMAGLGAKFLVSGEVLGQRPMSQRRDTLDVILRDAGVRSILLRPLCAKLMEPTQAETSGLVDRERLYRMNGRGRAGQLRLAAEFGLTEIPTPGGGCKLTQPESCLRYYPLFARAEVPSAEDFRLANAGRQFWLGHCQLAVGRHDEDNGRLEKLAQTGDTLFVPGDYMGPSALLRSHGPAPDVEILVSAAALAASYAPKAVARGGEVEVEMTRIGSGAGMKIIRVVPERHGRFKEPAPWDEVRDEFRRSRVVNGEE